MTLQTEISRVLVIGSLWPEPASSGAGLRMLELSQLFVRQGWQVTYASTAAVNEHSVDLSLLGISCVTIAVNDSGFDHFVAGLQPDVVLFDRFSMEEQFGWRVEKACPDAMRIIETIDLHLLREARQQLAKGNRSVIRQPSKAALFNEIALREIAALLRSDLSILVSDFEVQLLQEQFLLAPALLHYCPFMFEPADLHRASPAFEARRHFITIGNFRHPPNWDAVLWLKEAIWPLIRRELPEAELHVYGAYAPPRATALDDVKSGFRVPGRAADVHTVMQSARVCLAPLRFGAGIKTKLADAMIHGTPNVTTSIGAEGMHGGLPWGGALADDAVSFAAAAVALYRDERAWQHAQADGQAIVQALFDGERNGRALIARIREIRVRLPEHRLDNFVGAMLRHHHQRSTEFMSRWIEAKNRT
ncbi:glycosyltransferase [Mariprofundus erugo]|uniref:glycosyltransferase n=1 Tax=Mariprofundus erugo TaxID=2528639 RepID=UPI0010FE93F6|nr:glycosyltransferase [Mariprofundus erugo]TLS75819.1 glycosyltransferase [Mariprofundus erugo]